ncbi:cytoplasmic tRNA 2-thiolation protein 2 [Rutidosis leptorrhynchoides]|uniref:cytoplasmic tRNA 2-thiolation protein 2 n=1 Tax=Rutidosis leptorrhynchoides TaxID=125765 RepID=UPI003A993732
MACNGGGCESGCYKYTTTTDVDLKSSKSTVDDSSYGGNHPRHQTNTTVCLKCKATEATVFTGGDGGGRFCSDCFRSNLYGKFKLAVTSNAMISPTDKVLVAFSGGPSSRVTLQFISEMQLKAQKNFDATANRDRCLPVFGVGVAFIDESDVHPINSVVLEETVEGIKQIVSSLPLPTKQLHVAPIRSIYSTNTSDGEELLKNLLNTVSDVTGKEDLVAHLCMLSLQKIAIENGYTKLMLGSCTSRIACHVLAATVKGQGYSLAADIQYADARWDVPVVLPLRDCPLQELKILCNLDNLKIVEVFNDFHSGINGLISSFMKTLQEENPARECTIVRTAGKLTPFPFNRIPEANVDDDDLAFQKRQKKFSLKPIESLPPDSFCPICNSPMSHSNNTEPRSDLFGSACCSSCQYQIIPNEMSSIDKFYSFLPESIIARAKKGNQNWIRERIQDCLLLDEDDEV